MKQTIFLTYVLCLAVAHTLTGQSWTAEAPVRTTEEGFYKIMLSPALAPFLNEDFTNIRLYDGGGKEVPYLFREEKPVYTRQQFREYTILSTKQEKACCTTLILENADRRPINNLSLLIRNADVSKQAVLSGSEDLEHWFAVKERFVLEAANNPEGTAEVKAVDFPLSNYRYYSLRLADSASLPLNILKAGYYDLFTYSGAYTPVPLREIIPNDSVKKTYVKLHFDAPQFVDKLDIAVSGAPFYHRRAYVIKREVYGTRKNGRHVFDRVLTSFALTSAKPVSIQVPKVKARELWIVIENEDNPSLAVTGINVFQQNRYLVAWLKGNEDYALKAGAESMTAPVYDLAFFQDRIPQSMPERQTDNVRLIAAGETTAAPSVFSSYMIWAALVVVIGALGFMSVRMIKEASKDEGNAR